MVQVEQRSLLKAGLLNMEGELAVALCLTLIMCMTLTLILCLSLYRFLTLKPKCRIRGEKFERNMKQNNICIANGPIR